MKSTTLAGSLLIAGALAGVLIMLTHPNARDLLEAAEPGREAAINVAVHSLGIAALPAVFLGLWGLTRILGATDLSLAALVLYGFGAIATLPAGVASGFVATGLITDALTGRTPPDTVDELLRFSGHLNRGFFTVGVVAVSLALLLWSVAILRQRRLPRGLGLFGLLVGIALPAAVGSGHLTLDLHGFGVVTVLQSTWFLWAGVLLLRPRPRVGEPIL